MKKTCSSIFCLMVFGLAVSSLSAQPPGGRSGDRQPITPEQRAERQAAFMQDTLSLSDDLTAEVKAVLLVYAKKMQEARVAANEDREAMRSAMQTLRQQQNEELQAMLGQETWARWEAVTAERGMRGQRGSGPPAEPGKGKRKKKDTGSDQ